MRDVGFTPSAVAAEAGFSSDAPRFEFTLFDLLIALLKRKRLICVVTLAAGILGLIIGFCVPLSFTGVTKLMPPQQNQSLSSSLLGQLGPLAGLMGAGSNLAGKNTSELYVAILQSQTVGDDLVQKFHLVSVYHAKLLVDARKKLASRSDIVASKEGIITISVTDHDPVRAAAIANAYVDELYKLNQSLAISEAAQRRKFFEQQLDQEKDRLADAEVALAQTEQKSGLIQLDSQARAAIEQNSRLEAALATAEVQLRAMGAYATSQNPQYVSLQQQVAALQAQLAKNASNVGPGKYQIGTAKLPELGVEYLRRMRDLKYHEALYEMLLQQTEAAKLDEAKSASIIQVLDKAQTPERKSAPRRLFYLIGGLLFGVFATTLWALGVEFVAKAGASQAMGPQVHTIQKLLRFKTSSEPVNRIPV